MTLRHALFFVALMVVVDVRSSEAQCSYSVSPTTVSVPSFGTNSSLSVITGSSCTYGATSPESWITITSVTGRGLGQVNFSVAENTTGATRVGTITVAGITVTLTQSASSCTATVMPTSVSVPAIGSSSAIAVTTGSSCNWTAATTAAWITVTSFTGRGLGQANYTTAANPTGTTRTGTISVAGQTVTLTQAAGSGGGPQPPAPPTNVIIR